MGIFVHIHNEKNNYQHFFNTDNILSIEKDTNNLYRIYFKNTGNYICLSAAAGIWLIEQIKDYSDDVREYPEEGIIDDTIEFEKDEIPKAVKDTFKKLL